MLLLLPWRVRLHLLSWRYCITLPPVGTSPATPLSLPLSPLALGYWTAAERQGPPGAQSTGYPWEAASGTCMGTSLTG
jgi:hypothetical protein